MGSWSPWNRCATEFSAFHAVWLSFYHSPTPIKSAAAFLIQLHQRHSAVSSLLRCIGFKPLLKYLSPRTENHQVIEICYSSLVFQEHFHLVPIIIGESRSDKEFFERIFTGNRTIRENSPDWWQSRFNKVHSTSSPVPGVWPIYHITTSQEEIRIKYLRWPTRITPWTQVLTKTWCLATIIIQNRFGPTHLCMAKGHLHPTEILKLLLCQSRQKTLEQNDQCLLQTSELPPILTLLP